MSAPSISVIVPMFNAPEKVERALAALNASDVEFELIVVDDAGTDPRSPEIARAAGANLLRLAENSGPGVARNEGAKHASGELLIFIDSDVVVHADTLAKFRDLFAAEPALDAAFGSYDDAPDAKGWITEYRNLLHHYVHHTGPSDATTFWAGCGAIRRRVFEEVGGYDPYFDRPSIEDIELGMRLKARGKTIRLRPDIQCKHLKRWRFVEMIRVDVTCRAIPWAKLLIERPGTGGDLNLELAQKLCGVLVVFALASLFGAGLAQVWFPSPWWFVAPVALLAPVVWINRGLYALFVRHDGPLFALGATALHFLYYVYSVVAFAYAQLRFRVLAPRANGN
ncbi:MAG: glycosyltransferase [Planctomycetes bacterium]|nr:glycosyltransferase [Planctomycetota bacterium]